MTTIFRFTICTILGALAATSIAAPRNPTPSSIESKRWVALGDSNTLDWHNLPEVPPEGTIHIDSNMTTRCVSKGMACWPYIIDTTSTCSFVVDPSMTCIGRNGTGCDVPDTLRNDEFKAMRKSTVQLSSEGNLTDAVGTCFYPQRKTQVRGTYAVANPFSALGGYHLADIRMLLGKEFNSDSIFYQGYNDFAGRAKDRAFGVLGFGEFGGMVPKPTNKYVSPLMASFIIPGGPVPHFSIAMPRGDKEGAVVIGGWPANSGSTAYSRLNITVPSLNFTGNPNHGIGKRDSVDLPYSFMNRPYIVQVDEFRYADVQPKGTNNHNGQGKYIIDSMSPVIRTSPDNAKKIAAFFNPPATQSGSKGDPNYYVKCDAKMTGGYSMSIALIGGVNTPWASFPISQEDFIVPMPNGQCISAFQPVLEGDVMRLGWPFFKNTMLGFSFLEEQTLIHVWARMPER